VESKLPEARQLAIVEALLFAADRPLQPLEVREAMGDEASQHMDMDSLVAVLNDQYEKQQRSFRIQKIGGAYQITTNSDFADFIRRLENIQAKTRLTQKSLETLAIIAYQQPVTRPEIEAIRGVNSDYIIRQLLERDLITITGRAEAPGQPLLYGTSKRFLNYFGLNQLADLPKLKEIDELLRSDDRFLKKLQQYDIEKLDADKLGIEFVEKIKSVLLPDKQAIGHGNKTESGESDASE
jgi:segregation and condensation protein B